MWRKIAREFLLSSLLVWLAVGLTACGGGAADEVNAAQPVVAQPSEPPLQTPPPPAPTPTTANPSSAPDPTTIDVGPWVLDPVRGRALFLEKCQQCHGPDALGGYGPALDNTVTCPPCAEFTRLWKRIDEYMPFRNPEACDAACSRDIAAWIKNDFSTAPSCSVNFRYDSVAGQRFMATILINNFNFRGIAVPAWRLGFTLPATHRVIAASNAVAAQSGDQVLLTPFATTPGIPSGAVLEIRLEGTYDGLAVVPVDLRLEAPPCFTAPPTG